MAENECAWVGLPWSGNLKNDMATPARKNDHWNVDGGAWTQTNGPFHPRNQLDTS